MKINSKPYPFNMTGHFMTRWILLVNIIIMLGACSFTSGLNTPAPIPEPVRNTPAPVPEPVRNTPSPESVAVRNTPQIFTTPAAYTPVPPEEVWLDLLQQNPFPYTTPLPDRTATVLDSIYAKVEPKEGTPVPCRRCPDYLIEGGVWKLSLDRGAYHIFHEATRWRSLGSYSMSGDRFYLFNDPACLDETGSYTWQMVEGGLRLELIQDTCQVGRRGQNFAGVVWQSCQPTSTEAAVTDHWPRPVGC